ncbi:MAG TPA: TlpA disulfide reductase family protein [Bryobacteraceae bacterium]|nr:TlpA disulfide reductase family protein [Bryobacteraceae bacterium]
MPETPRLNGFSLGVCAALLSAAAVFAATVPRPLLDMPIPTPSGKPINLKQYRGKVVLIAIISMDCAPCVKSIEIFNRVQKDFGNKGFQVVAAVGDANAQYLLGPFMQRYRPEFPMGYLNTDEMVKLGGFSREDRPFAPILIFVSRQGIVRQQVTGDQPFFKNEEPEIRAVIQKLLIS